MRKTFFNFFTKLTALATIASSLALSTPVHAAEFASISNTTSRLKQSTTASHSFSFVLPAGIDFDVTGSTDKLIFEFGSSWTSGGTWITSEFTFDDGTARTIDDVAQGPGTSSVSCANGANNVGVAIDTTASLFRVIPCGASFAASSTAATITFTIDGSDGNGTLTNPSSPGSREFKLKQDDEGGLGGIFTKIALPTTEDDQVSASATVAPTLTFDIDSGTSQGSNNDGTHTIAIGTIVPGTTKSSDQSGINSIFIDLDTNASGGAVVSVKNTNGANGLTSASVAADDIDSTDATMNATDENYGLCVESVTETQVASGSLGAVSPFDGSTCTAGGVVNVVGGLDGTVQTILSVNNAIEGGRAEILVNASANAITTAHDDYADTLTFIATGTF